MTVTVEQEKSMSCVTGLSWLRRRHELLHGGTDVTVIRSGQGIWRLNRGLSAETASRILAEHDRASSQHRWLKNDVKRRITEVDVDGCRYVVKEYLHVFALGIFSPDQRGWLCGNRLAGAVPCLGWYRDGGRGVIIMAFAGRQSLNLWHCSVDIDCMEPKYRRAGELIAELHQEGIYHADLKPSNFVAVNEHDFSSDVVLIDCDDVRCPLVLTEAHRTKNLAQFLGGLSYAVPDCSERRRLVRAALEGYLSHAGAGHSLKESNHRLFNRIVKKIYPLQWASYLEIEDEIWGAEAVKANDGKA